MTEQKTAPMNRRGLLRLTGIMASAIPLAALGGKAFADTSTYASSFAKPTADAPIRINFNENPIGMSPKAQDAARAAVGKAHRYAKAEIEALHAKLAQLYHVPESAILLTAGSSEGIRAAIEAYALPNTQFVIPELTYGDGEAFAKIAHLKITKVPMTEPWQFDIEAMKRAVAQYDGPSLVYLVNPNNPTSSITPADLIEPWIASNPKDTMFIVDEAYAEFVNDPRFRSVAPLIEKGAENVILLKTFSKIYAMAGMRVGYALAAPQVIAKMADTVAGEKISFPAAEAALVSMDDHDFIAQSKKSNDTSRAIVLKALDAFGIRYVQPEGNFVFFQLKNSTLAQFQEAMKKEHIIVGRAFPPATNWCRLSFGTPQEMAYVVTVLKQFHDKGQL